MLFMKRPTATCVAALALSASPIFAAVEDAERLTASTQVLREIMAADDKGIPTDLFKKAHCVVVVPNMKKGGFIVTAKYGRGFATCRVATGWSAPAAMRVEGGGVGFQIGASETDLIMLVMSEKGMQGMLSSKFTLGGEASVAAGPVGRDASAQTDATMKADILSWSRSRGVFGGISLQGGTLRPDEDGNKGLYGKSMENKDILTGKSAAPADAHAFLAEVQKYAGVTEK
jgi:SH3 domain-containing YSC84-like protein 1